jgi:iron complex outermembrane receptor protein
VNRFAVLLASTAALAAPAFAQQPPQAPPPAPAPAPAAPADQPHEGHEHHDESQTIIVTGVRQLDILAGTSVLSGEELQREVRTQIGETLTRLPGVSATSFSPGASRPVLRGFQGERIRVLTDGIGSIDVSNTSADHAVTIDPLTAERVEVLHGPAVLLFGSQAIGGAVNVIERRIPRSVPEEGVHGDIIGVLGSAADERSIGGAVDVALGNGFVAHLDGSFRKSDDLRTGGFVLSEELREEQLEIAREELEEGHPEEAAEAIALANLRGEIPNSATEQKSAGAALALIRNAFNIGASISRFDSRYGVPGRPGAGHGDEEEGGEEGEEEHGEEPVSIDLTQTRYDLRGEYEFASGLFESARLRVGAANYEHTEFEGEEVGTIFKSDGIEGRLEFAQRDRNGWRGASGVQYFTRDFEAIGPEAFIPPNDTQQLGLFTLQEIDLGRVGLEAAGRYEHSRHSADTLGLERSFDAFSAAVGASYELAPRVSTGLNLSRSERAPSAEELFAGGPHIATQAFEIGDPDLDTEKSIGAEAYLRVEKAGFEFNATAFANWFDDFIFQAATGEVEDGLPVFKHRQRGATFYGFEAEASARLFEAGGYRFVADAVADYVRATIEEGGPVPRIPPLRLLGGLEAQSEKVDGRLEVEWSDDQTRVAQFENSTDSFTLVNTSVAWRPWGKAREATLILSANNLFDVEARRHASFTKEFVPLAGRDIRLSARFGF